MEDLIKLIEHVAKLTTAHNENVQQLALIIKEVEQLKIEVKNSRVYH